MCIYIYIYIYLPNEKVSIYISQVQPKKIFFKWFKHYNKQTITHYNTLQINNMLPIKKLYILHNATNNPLQSTNNKYKKQ